MVEQDKLEGERSDAMTRQQALERAVAELAEGKRLTATEREALDRENHELRARQLDSERSVDAAKNELSLRRNRLRALEDLHRRLEGVGAGARALLSKADPRVLGLVGDRLETPEELTAAVAGLLGSRLQSVVVSTATRQSPCSRAAPGIAAGRILPPDPAIRGARPTEESRVARSLCIASASPSGDALVRSLVATALVETAADAVRLAARLPGATLVSLDGTVAHPDGVVSGGSGDDVASAKLEQKREMQKLAVEVARLEVEAARLTADHQALRTRMTEVGTALERARQFAHEGELAHVTAEKDLARTRGDIDRMAARIGAVANELAESDRLIAEGSTAEAESRAALDALVRIAHAETISRAPRNWLRAGASA